VGLLEDFTKSATIDFKAAEEVILLVGDTQGWLGQSLYLREICDREEGAPPPVDLAGERRNGDLVRALIGEGAVTAVHDVSDGGLLTALAEMAIASGIGADLDVVPTAAHAFWFGEDQGRYVITALPAEAERIAARARAAGIPIRPLGVTGGDSLTLRAERPILVSQLRESFESWLPAYMAGKMA
jgi:phosphoribosylformylglycinamidine synthase